MEKYKRKIGYFQKIQMVKLSKDNKIKNKKDSKPTNYKNKTKKYSHYCETISVRRESFSKFLFIQFFLIDEKFGSNIVKHYEGANNIGFQHNLLLNLIAIVSLY